MKKLLAGLMALSLSASIFALGIGIGVKGDIGGTTLYGQNTTTVSGSGYLDGTTTVKYEEEAVFTGAVGGVIAIDVSEEFTIQPEFVYRFANGAKDKVGPQGVVNFQTFEIPVLFSYKFSAGPGKIFLSAGPTLNFLMKKTTYKTNDTTLTRDTSDIYATFTVGGVAAAGYELNVGPGALAFGGRVYSDVTNLAKITKKSETLLGITTTYTDDLRRLYFTGDVSYIYRF